MMQTHKTNKLIRHYDWEMNEHYDWEMNVKVMLYSNVGPTASEQKLYGI